MINNKRKIKKLKKSIREEFKILIKDIIGSGIHMDAKGEFVDIRLHDSLDWYSMRVVATSSFRIRLSLLNFFDECDRFNITHCVYATDIKVKLL